jgi:serine-type D-Ala-D-Ala carboxypeptidase (penicillin-binding protein 5/6)
MALLGRLGRRLLSLAFVLTAFASVVAARPAAAAPGTQVPQAYIAVDADTGCVVTAKNEHDSLLTASTAKLLTAITALERLRLNSTVPITPRAAAQPAMKINMHAGEVWKFDDALHSLLIVSANDAAYAIAERASGSIEQFAKDAQAVAEQLGAQNTKFGDPAGLDDANSYAGGTHMSAYDLAVVARNALSIPEIANTSKTLDYDFVDPTGAGRHLRNHNDGFLTSYAGATGLKTGFTKAANRTLVTSATRNGRTMIAVVMNTWDDTGWASYLLDQGFATAAKPTCTASVPPVRAVTADTRAAAFGGLPGALGMGGGAALVGTNPATATTTPSSSTPTTSTTKPATTKDAAAATTKSETAATTAASTDDSGSSGFSLGSIFNLKVFAIVVFVVLLTLFLLRRRAVRRQRTRRIARQKRMAEIRRRRMIDVVDPAQVKVDAVSHVKVVPAQSEAAL